MCLWRIQGTCSPLDSRLYIFENEIICLQIFSFSTSFSLLCFCLVNPWTCNLIYFSWGLLDFKNEIYMSLRSFYLSFNIWVNFSFLSKNFYSCTGCGIKNIFNSCLKYFHVPLYFPIWKLKSILTESLLWTPRVFYKVTILRFISSYSIYFFYWISSILIHNQMVYNSLS